MTKNAFFWSLTFIFFLIFRCRERLRLAKQTPDHEGPIHPIYSRFHLRRSLRRICHYYHHPSQPHRRFEEVNISTSLVKGKLRVATLELWNLLTWKSTQYSKSRYIDVTRYDLYPVLREIGMGFFLYEWRSHEYRKKNFLTNHEWLNFNSPRMA